MEKPDGRRSSEVLDAILDKVTEKPERTGPANVLFRTKALEQLDVAAEIDTRLPLVSRRSWLALLGVGLLVIAFALWASLTPSVTSLSAQGRVASPPGAIPVSAQVDAVVSSVEPPGTVIAAGAPVATILTAEGSTTIRSAVDGSVWQQVVVPGATVRAGEPVVTLLPPGSDTHVLLALPEAQAMGVTAGLSVQIAGMGTTPGTVDSVSGPMTAAVAGERTGLALADSSTYVLVGVTVPAPLQTGAAVSATIVLSEGTVLTRLLGRT